MTLMTEKRNQTKEKQNTHFWLISYRELDVSTCELELVSNLSGQVQSLITTKTIVASLMVSVIVHFNLIAAF